MGSMAGEYLTEEGNGEHRRTTTAVHGDTDKRADPGHEGAKWSGTSARTIARTGIRLGEIIAWRAWMTWYVDHGLLGSLCCPEQFVWAVDAPAQSLSGPGLHAWKTDGEAIAWIRNLSSGGIVGRVALWGDVTEYERGYTAEFGRVVSLDHDFRSTALISSIPTMEDLRERYGV